MFFLSLRGLRDKKKMDKNLRGFHVFSRGFGGDGEDCEVGRGGAVVYVGGGAGGEASGTGGAVSDLWSMSQGLWPMACGRGVGQCQGLWPQRRRECRCRCRCR